MSQENQETLWNIFTKNASLHETNVAVEDADGTGFTYAELSKLVTSLTSHLSLAQSQNPFVVSLLPPGIQFIVASLATLGVGKIVVVLHYTCTSTQVEKCLALLNYPTVVTTVDKWTNLDTVFGFAYPHLLFYPEVQDEYTNGHGTEAPKNEEDHLLVHDLSLEGVSYCYFTSGSTGTPKAVLLRDTSVVKAIHGCVATDVATFSAEVRGSLGVALSFTLSLCEIWTIFFSGGTLVIPPADVRLDVDLYRTWLAHKTINSVFLVTSFLEQLLVKEVDTMKSLRWVGFGGTRINPNRIRLFDATFTAHHIYFTSETFLTTVATIPPGEGTLATTSVGCPFPGVKVYLVDDEGCEIKSPDIKGGIYVAGAGLMRGYYGQPDLTAKVLIPNLFDTEMSPMYDTGDVGYWSEGCLHVSGRKDNQVEIDGVRLELGEIEAVICTYHGIDETVVLALEDHGALLLYGFCTVVTGTVEPERELLYEFLQKNLQPQAIPRSIAFLPEFPTNCEGKVDVVQLKVSLTLSQEVVNNEEEEVTNHHAEVSDWLKTVRSAWASVLKLNSEQIQPSDNFFRLGGNSLMVFNLMEELRLAEPKLTETSPFVLFKFPVLKDFAEALGFHRTVNMDRSEINFKSEIELPADFPKRPAAAAILITGTTGFLGSHILLDALKEYEDDEIYTVVRGGTKFEAAKRLEAALGMKSLPAKVRCLAGDLTKRKFGLDSAVYSNLVTKVQLVFHAAAESSYMKTYEQLRETTVVMTTNVLRFAMEGSPKHLHFISTVGVFDGVKSDSAEIYDAMEERLSIEIDPSRMLNADFQSKWVSEQLVWACVKRGLVASFYRLGQLGAQGRTKSVNKSDALAGFIVMCKRLGRFPVVTQKVPFVDGHVSDGIIALSKANRSNIYGDRVFHLVGDEVGFERFFEGMQLVPVSLAEWESSFQFSVAPAPKTQDEMNAWIFLRTLKQVEDEANPDGKRLMKNIKIDVSRSSVALGPERNTCLTQVDPRWYANLVCGMSDDN